MVFDKFEVWLGGGKMLTDCGTGGGHKPKSMPLDDERHIVDCGADERHKPKLMALEEERHIVSLTYALRPSGALNSCSR